MSRPTNIELATTALDFPGWKIPDQSGNSGIRVIDKKGSTVARVPIRSDDLDIAHAISALPDMIRICEDLLNRKEILYMDVVRAMDKVRGR